MARSMISVENDGDKKSTVIKPIRLTDQILEAIKEQIFARRLNPGDRVVEQKIAREMGVGQNAVREALIELSHLGFVRRIPNVGTFVTELTQADAEKLSPVRTALETLVIDLLALRLQREDLDLGEAEELLRKMRESAVSRDIVSFFNYDMQFHRLLWRLADNEYLDQLLEQIVVPLFAFFIMLNIHPLDRADLFIESVEYHEKVLGALRSHSPIKAHEAICQLLEISLRQQHEIISEKQIEKMEVSPANGDET
ncbi:MAG: GntR family transcriptional regulator [Acidobacteria bacterium]|nr:GntR family transcriptional regulator [Acidobacteriota bacterium]